LTKASLFPLKDGQTVLAQPTQRWAALPTFANGKVVDILEKNNNRAVNFETKDEGDFCYMYLRSMVQISNLRSLTKKALFPLKDGQTVLAQPTQRMGGPTFVNEKVVYILEKQNNIALNFETKEQRRLLL